MENRSLDRFKEIVNIKIISKNIDKVLKNIYNLKITILNVKYINRKEIYIRIYLKDYDKLKKTRLIDEINIVESYGKLKLKNIINNNKLFFIMLILGYILLLFLSNIIFKVDVIHSDLQLREYVIEIMRKKGIKPLTYKKTFDEINNIKEEVLEENKDKIEWLEIERIGTKYIIKIEERKKIEEKEEYIYQDIISSKTAIIKKIEAENGVIMKKVNDLVIKGETIISGNIYKNEEIVNVVKASGKIYGEVWYNIKVEFPLIIDKKEETGKNKKIYSINIFNMNIPLFDFNFYKYKTKVSKNIFYNRLLPINISRETQYELNIINGIYSIGEALIEAEKYASNKINNKLKDGEYIIKRKVIDYSVQNDKIDLEVFYKIYENITDTKEIIPE